MQGDAMLVLAESEVSVPQDITNNLKDFIHRECKLTKQIVLNAETRPHTQGSKQWLVCKKHMLRTLLI